MSDDTDALRDIFLDIAEEESVTESQKEAASHAPFEGETSDEGVHPDDGLDDAVDRSFNRSELDS